MQTVGQMDKLSPKELNISRVNHKRAEGESGIYKNV